MRTREADHLKEYFEQKFGVTGVSHADDLLKALERVPADKISPPIRALISDLADVVMMGSGYHEYQTSQASCKKASFFD